VVLDGDSLAHTWPGGMDRKRLDLIERNLLHCAEGYRIWGAQYCFCNPPSGRRARCARGRAGRSHDGPAPAEIRPHR
jgi:hypothetical protein